MASRNIVHFLKKVILRCIGLCFNYHHLYLLSRLDQPLIQRIPAGLSSTVACLDITNMYTHFLPQNGSKATLRVFSQYRSRVYDPSRGETYLSITDNVVEFTELN